MSRARTDNGPAPEPERRRLSQLDRLIERAMGEQRSFGLDTDPAREQYPLLWDWLSRTLVGLDHLKQPGVLTVRLGPSGVLTSLTDRDLGATLDVACLHLGDVYEALEVALASATPTIRSWGKHEPVIRKRKRKS